MDKFNSFWTRKRRALVYGVVVALVPLLVSVGWLAGDVAGVVLQVTASLLAVGSGSMALANLTPDDILTVGMKAEDTK